MSSSSDDLTLLRDIVEQIETKLNEQIKNEKIMNLITVGKDPKARQLSEEQVMDIAKQIIVVRLSEMFDKKTAKQIVEYAAGSLNPSSAEASPGLVAYAKSVWAQHGTQILIALCALLAAAAYYMFWTATPLEIPAGEPPGSGEEIPPAIDPIVEKFNSLSSQEQREQFSPTYYGDNRPATLTESGQALVDAWLKHLLGVYKTQAKELAPFKQLNEAKEWAITQGSTRGSMASGVSWDSVDVPRKTLNFVHSRLGAGSMLGFSSRRPKDFGAICADQATSGLMTGGRLDFQKLTHSVMSTIM